MKRSEIRERPVHLLSRSRIALRCATLHPGYGWQLHTHRPLLLLDRRACETVDLLQQLGGEPRAYVLHLTLEPGERHLRLPFLQRHGAHALVRLPRPGEPFVLARVDHLLGFGERLGVALTLGLRL